MCKPKYNNIFFLWTKKIIYNNNCLSHPGLIVKLESDVQFLCQDSADNWSVNTNESHFLYYIYNG